MDTVLFTQRVEVIESYGERRDCADQNIARFIHTCGFLPVPVPNIKEIAVQMLIKLEPVGIVLTGGNSFVKYGGDAPERDVAEKGILQFCIKNNIPVYGFCRGMQVILDYFGCKLEEVQGHAGVRHKLLKPIGSKDTNSFHNQGCFQINPPLVAEAWAGDGVIEAVTCQKYNILGTMWHPEREKVFKEEDIIMVQDLFKRGCN